MALSMSQDETPQAQEVLGGKYWIEGVPRGGKPARHLCIEALMQIMA